VERFPKLEALSLSTNGFQVVPVEIAQLGNLRTLYLDDNSIAVLPSLKVSPRFHGPHVGSSDDFLGPHPPGGALRV
jgi:Leucine-rich repeat (LRR) protein